MTQIVEMDQLFGTLLLKLEENGLYNSTNLIVVSDHGMSQLNTSSYIDIYKYAKNGSIDFEKSIIYGVVSNLYATKGNVF
jgi:predicted AlkP superfamily pyrophosphatase or phosphodiesterase